MLKEFFESCGYLMQTGHGLFVLVDVLGIGACVQLVTWAFIEWAIGDEQDEESLEYA